MMAIRKAFVAVSVLFAALATAAPTQNNGGLSEEKPLVESVSTYKAPRPIFPVSNRATSRTSYVK
jgi:hypothetical protein